MRRGDVSPCDRGGGPPPLASCCRSSTFGRAPGLLGGAYRRWRQVGHPKAPLPDYEPWCLLLACLSCPTLSRSPPWGEACQQSFAWLGGGSIARLRRGCHQRYFGLGALLCVVMPGWAHSQAAQCFAGATSPEICYFLRFPSKLDLNVRNRCKSA